LVVVGDDGHPGFDPGAAGLAFPKFRVVLFFGQLRRGARADVVVELGGFLGEFCPEFLVAEAAVGDNCLQFRDNGFPGGGEGFFEDEVV
jgi:hypothetical protein